MNILFLSVYAVRDSDSGYIYADLVREFAKEHNVYAVTPAYDKTEAFTDGNGVHIVRVKNGQIQKTGRIKKVVNLLLLEKRTIKAVRKYAKGIQFDLIVNMSSNLSYGQTMRYFGKRDRAVKYLLVKDIFPQNAVDIGMMTRDFMGFVYRHFRKKERKVYRDADYIGCLSPANVEFLQTHNAQLKDKPLTVVYNSIEPVDVSLDDDERNAMRDKYGIPRDKTVFVYGGNLGKPQDVPFIIECLKTQTDNENVFFLIVGDGTEYGKFETFMRQTSQTNVKVLKRLPREDFDRMLASCDVGMIFLDHRFTVPNYPSRLLSYMQAGLAVLACTDPNTDVGRDAVDGGYGVWCESNNVAGFTQAVDTLLNANLQDLGNAAKVCLVEQFSVQKSYREIMSAVQA